MNDTDAKMKLLKNKIKIKVMIINTTTGLKDKSSTIWFTAFSSKFIKKDK